MPFSGIGLAIIKNSYKDFFQNSTHSFFCRKIFSLENYKVIIMKIFFYMKMENIYINMHAKNCQPNNLSFDTIDKNSDFFFNIRALFKGKLTKLQL